MTRVLLVPDLPLERWPWMDRYAYRLHDWLESTDPGFEVRLAASIGDLTRDRGNGRSSGGYPRWWAQDVDPTKLVLPGPLHEPQRYVARYVLYPWWLRREAKRAQLVHILDHSYAHMVTRVQRRPAIVTVHDLMPVIILRSPTDGWREGVRNRFLRGTLKALRLARSRSEEHTSELQSPCNLVCRLLLEKKQRACSRTRHPGKSGLYIDIPARLHPRVLCARHVGDGRRDLFPSAARHLRTTPASRHLQPG